MYSCPSGFYKYLCLFDCPLSPEKFVYFINHVFPLPSHLVNSRDPHPATQPDFCLCSFFYQLLHGICTSSTLHFCLTNPLKHLCQPFVCCYTSNHKKLLFLREGQGSLCNFTKHGERSLLQGICQVFNITLSYHLLC